ncbi:TetR family transcriptional regulator [Mycobacterium yunnanensis]|uniref:TetR family transcriptional regulator n=1 Tax=Mycobacterium yunnanensis TaxID=368477 RepID=A0A9X2YZJ4_9MYCO|nr:TetR/AcrR family transcriptional regulator [Mycobacterium yunnanensis]MCV7421315.1 TetR family transcriptional regulator [Mycobacterium yunnanensis]
MAAPEGLRARRRRETAREIHLAALRLTRQHGFDVATVEAISAEAGIAPRTFFNYFPSKEAAVVHGPFDLDQADVSAFTGGATVSYAELLTELVELLAANLAADPPSRDELHDVFAVSQEHPGVLAAMLAQLEGFQRRVAELVAVRLNRPADDEEATLIAALALTILRAGFDRWVHEAAEPARTPAADIAHVAALMNDMFGDRHEH